MSSTKDLIYQLEDRPTTGAALLAAFQHVLASFIGIITPTLVIGGVLGLGEEIPYLISMALFVSGVATLIQVKGIGPVGSGLLSIQGTSFSFVGGVIAAGLAVKGQGGDTREVLATVFGVCMVGSFIEMALSRFLGKLRKIITPTVTGIVVCLIGLSLIKVGITDIAGGFGAEDFGSLRNLGIAALVILTVLILQLSRYPMLRLSAIFIGLVVGCLVAAILGKVSVPGLDKVELVAIPQFFKYGLSFSWEAFLPLMFIFVITAIETVGDLTASSRVSGQPCSGPVYEKRIQGGVLGDGLNSLLAGCLNTFPNTTFSQNNGVIQLTGVASRYVGFFVAGIFILLGLFPAVGAVLQSIPKPVLGATTTLMFGTIAVAGIRILASEEFNRKKVLTVAISFGLGLGVALVPDLLQGMPPLVQKIFSSSITTGGLTAILCTLLLPDVDITEEEPKAAVEKEVSV
ncbi:uracil-xanthine permease family protein [Vibrio mangrovi]|uniref:Nucleobase:cation symporter-2 family protein n=1 Tax=Vibrio mangrovi TaxID=474394 RepID=A0A1Y6IW05_9VIBR|nr:nucleobase:cation symporter-2 family protein [Vibrio mangrovi]MDW6001298.1 nucleobase:cation symporter-2 family protein [Vibrio mangrovi]SMS00682.1 Xanthine permease XanP [Vibrio mangrovi]